MTYLSYFRAKQNELLALSEKNKLLFHSKITPILEPINNKYSLLAKRCKKINSSGANLIIVANSTVGKCLIESPDHVNHIKQIASENEKNKIGILINPNKFDIKKLLQFIEVYKNYELVAIHPKPKRGTTYFSPARDYPSIADNFSHDVFLYEDQNLLNSTFKEKTLLIDCFNQRNNADYPEDEHFSDLHQNYKSKNFDKFGDFSIVGDNYSDGGGQAFAVAIHITYIDPNDGKIRIIHTKSFSNQDKSDQPGKYLEARDELARIIESKKYNIFLTEGLSEILNTKQNRGLGIIKKYSMKHHLELIANHVI